MASTRPSVRRPLGSVSCRQEASQRFVELASTLRTLGTSAADRSSGRTPPFFAFRSTPCSRSLSRWLYGKRTSSLSQTQLAPHPPSHRAKRRPYCRRRLRAPSLRPRRSKRCTRLRQISSKAAPSAEALPTPTRPPRRPLSDLSLRSRSPTADATPTCFSLPPLSSVGTFFKGMVSKKLRTDGTWLKYRDSSLGRPLLLWYLSGVLSEGRCWYARRQDWSRSPPLGRDLLLRAHVWVVPAARWRRRPGFTLVVDRLRDFSDLLGPPVALILNPRPRWRTPAIRIGSAVCALGLLLSAWATKVWVPLPSPQV